MPSPLAGAGAWVQTSVCSDLAGVLAKRKGTRRGYRGATWLRRDVATALSAQRHLHGAPGTTGICLTRSWCGAKTARAACTARVNPCGTATCTYPALSTPHCTMGHCDVQTLHAATHTAPGDTATHAHCTQHPALHCVALPHATLHLANHTVPCYTVPCMHCVQHSALRHITATPIHCQCPTLSCATLAHTCYMNGTMPLCAMHAHCTRCPTSCDTHVYIAFL